MSPARLALLLSLLPGAATAESWKDWPVCGSTSETLEAAALFGDRGRPAAKEGAASQDKLLISRRLYGEEGEDIDHEYHKEQFQLISIDPDDGKLVLNDAVVFEELGKVSKPINLIVLYGKEQTGKSTVASMLSCAMDQKEPLMFPPEGSTPGGSGFHTEGLWASAPIEYNGKYYVIADMQGLDAVFHKDKWASKHVHDAVIKLLSLLSEVTSVFLYVSQQKTLNNDDFRTIAKALKTNRENLIISSKQQEKELDSKQPVDFQIRSENHPKLLAIPKTNVQAIVAGDSYAFNRAKWDNDAITNWQAHGKTDASYKDLMEHNFEHHGQGDQAVPWHENPLPIMDDRYGDDRRYKWSTNQPFEYKYGAHCKLYKEMTAPKYKCKFAVGTDKFEPAPAPVYQLMIKTLADRIHDAAPQRSVTWSSGPGQPITGDKLKEFLAQGVLEMNNIGPLPDDALWKHILQDSCKAQLVEQMDLFLGKGVKEEGAMVQKGALKRMEEILAPSRPPKNERVPNLMEKVNEEWAGKNVEVVWSSEQVPAFFKKNAMMKAVQDECTAHANIHYKKLLEEAYKLVLVAKQSETQWKADDYEKQAKKLQKELDDASWERDRPFIIILMVCGLVAFFALCYFFTKVQTTCREFLSCCGDCCFSSTKTQVFQKRNSQGGVEMQGVYQVTQEPALPLPWAGAGASSAAAGALTNAAAPVAAPAADEAMKKRIEALEQCIVQLTGKISAEDRSAMHLKTAGP